MADITIIGGGFSASVASLLSDTQCRVISPRKSTFLGMPRRKSIEINKLFSKHSESLGLLKFNLSQTSLHDRLIFGGNSGVWGGFINTTHLSNDLFEKFRAKGLKFKALSFNETGSISNQAGLAQIQDSSGVIFNASKTLKGFDDGYLESFFIEGHRIGLNLNLLGRKFTTYTSKLILCVGTVQLLDLLYRSGFIVDGDEIQLSEFGYQLKPKFGYSSKSILDEAAVIRFNLGRAICHYLGIQKKLAFFNFLNWLPLHIEQHFFSRRLGCLLKFSNGTLSDFSLEKNPFKFGGSIHYCNMRINGEGINDLFAKINSNVIGLGMPFVDQAEPGPISNDILNDAAFKLKHL